MVKILKILGGIIGGIIVLLVIASVIIIMIVDKKMVEDQMKSALNRHVTIKNIDVGIFSILSGIEVEEVVISNFKSANQIKALEGKPVRVGDIFIGLKSFKFKVKFLPLLSNKFVLKELTLYEPKINIVKGVNGGYNFDDLTKAKKLITAPCEIIGSFRVSLQFFHTPLRPIFKDVFVPFGAKNVF